MSKAERRAAKKKRQKEAKKAKSEASASCGAAAAGPNGQPPKGPEVDKETVDTRTARATLASKLKAKLGDKVDLVSPALESVWKDLEKEAYPMTRVDHQTAEEALHEYMSGSEACSAAAASSTLRVEVDRIRAGLDAMDGTEGPEVAALQELLKKKEAQLLKATKSLPSANLEHKGRLVAQGRFEEAMEQREDRVTRTIAAAASRKQVRVEKLNLLKAQVDLFIQQLNEEEELLAQEHTQRTIRRKARGKRALQGEDSQYQQTGRWRRSGHCRWISVCHGLTDFCGQCHSGSTEEIRGGREEDAGGPSRSQ